MLENVMTSLRDGLSLVFTFVPKLQLFLIILLIGYLLAKVLRKAVNAILERVGFDKAVQRGGVGRALAQSKYDASDLIATLVYYAVILITLQVAFGAFGPNPISDLLASIVAFKVLANIASIFISGLGSQRWETILNRAEQEAPRAAAQARANGGRAAADLQTTVAAAQPDRPSPAERVTTINRDGDGSYAPR